MSQEAKTPPPGEDWPEELPPEAADRRKAVDPHDPLSFLPRDAIRGVFDGWKNVADGLSKLIKRHTAQRSVALIHALDVEELESKINEFCDQPGIEILHISDRILRFGNEMIKELHYRNAAVIVGTQPIKDLKTGLEGTRYIMSDGTYADAFPASGPEGLAGGTTKIETPEDD